jgi:hypothetical protein
MRGCHELALDLGLDIVDGIGGLHLEGDGFTRNCARAVSKRSLSYLMRRGHTGLDEDLHFASAERGASAFLNNGCGCRRSRSC